MLNKTELLVAGMTEEAIKNHLSPTENITFAGSTGEFFVMTDDEEIIESFGRNAVGKDLESLSSHTVKLLKKSGKTVSLAETYTLGQIAYIIEASGGKDSLILKVDATSGDIKKSVLSCPSEITEKFGEVSSQVAAALAIGAMRKSGADIGLSVIGSDGEDAPSYIALCEAHGLWVMKTDRKDGVINYAFDMLRRYLSFGNSFAELYRGDDTYCINPEVLAAKELIKIPCRQEEKPTENVEEKVIDNDLIDDEVTVITADNFDEIIKNEEVEAPIEEAVTETVEEVTEEEVEEPEKSEEQEEIEKEQEVTEEEPEEEPKKAEKPEKVKKPFIRSVFPFPEDTVGEIIRKLVVIVVIVGIIASCTVLITSLTRNQITTDTNSEIYEIYNNAENTQDGNSIVESGIIKKFVPLTEINKDTIGWISNNSKDINAAVLKSDANYNYKNRNFYNKSNGIGSVYTDAASVIEKDSRSKNVILYGKDATGTNLFGALDNYRDIHYFIEYPEIQFDTLYSINTYVVVAAVDIKSGDGFNYRKTSFSSDTECEEFIATMRSKSLYTTNVVAEADDYYLTLVSNHGSGRFVLLLKMIDSSDTRSYSAHY